MFTSNIQRLGEVRLGYVAYLASLLSSAGRDSVLTSNTQMLGEVRLCYVAYLATLLSWSAGWDSVLMSNTQRLSEVRLGYVATPYSPGLPVLCIRIKYTVQRLSEVRLGYVANLGSLLSWSASTLYSHQIYKG